MPSVAPWRRVIRPRDLPTHSTGAAEKCYFSSARAQLFVLNALSELAAAATLDICSIDSEFARPLMIRKLATGKFRLYSRKKDTKARKRRNLGTFDTRAAAEKHERAVQYFKRH
jgi:hypothetical protein